MKLKSWFGVFIGLAFVILSAPAMAENGLEELERIIGKPSRFPPPLLKKDTPTKNDDSLRLTSNKDQIIRLDRDAASVIVNNPEHASVMLDSPRLLIVMPRLPGTTSFSVLDNQGEIILQKDVIVSNVQRQYVRIRRMCASSDASCVPAAYYYCPDGCYEVSPVTTQGGPVPPPATAAAVTTLNAAESLAPAPAPAAAPTETESAPVILDQKQ